LFHFVDNKDRFFFKLKNNEVKIEFTLNISTVGGLNFYNYLKANKIIEFSMGRSDESKCFASTTKFGFAENVEIQNSMEKGELASDSYQLIIITGSKNSNYNVIGKLKKLEDLDTIINSTENRRQYPFEFLFEEEKDEKPKIKNKSGNWKTVKILKIAKALKRYRLVKRMNKFKALKN